MKRCTLPSACYFFYCRYDCLSADNKNEFLKFKSSPISLDCVSDMSIEKTLKGTKAFSVLTCPPVATVWTSWPLPWVKPPLALFGPAVVSKGAGRAAEEAAEQREERTRPNQTQGPPPATWQDQGAVRQTQGGAGAVQDAVYLQARRRRGNQSETFHLCHNTVRDF